VKLNSEKLLEVSQVNKYYHGPLGAKIKVLENVSFSINENVNEKIVSILAPFGSGKTTLMKIVSALDDSFDGNVNVKGEKYSSPDGRIIFIPEKPSSFLWFNVKDNIEFIKRNSKNRSEQKTDEIISQVGLSGYENHHVHSESYGFRFRISLACALAVNPCIIIIDDSLKMMDHITRKEIYDLLIQLSKDINTKFLISTTNITEAILLSDKIILMKKQPGRVFHELLVEKEWKDKTDSEKGEKIHQIKNEIMKIFKTEKIANDLSFSV
jgi:ABC-type nitrate/sulfonate/bicarbonate transport system ATPase subunit